MKAPNGKISNLTDAQWHLVRTSAFKAWFGDWENDPANASKVVDKNGEPLVVYHGTFKKFNVFNYYNWRDIGFHFGTKEAAKHIIKGQLRIKKEIDPYYVILPCFLNLRNPVHSVDMQGEVDEHGNEYLADWVEILEYLKAVPKEKARKWLNDFWQENKNLNDGDVSRDYRLGEYSRNKLIEYGIDGVFYKNANEDIGSTSWIAFLPNQIKIADSSNTIFDQKNPDIRFAKGGSLTKKMKAPNGKVSNLTDAQWHLVRTPAFKAWFGDWENDPANASKVVDKNGEPLVVYHGTNKEFYSFEDKKRGTSTKANLAWLGFYFTDDRSLANDFTKKKWSNPASKFKSGARIIDVFLNIRNPKEWTVYQFIQQSNIDKETLSSFTGALIRSGFDGLTVEKAVDDWEKHLREFDGKQYVAFSSNQIKLADGSNITFDSHNPDIRFAIGGQIIKPKVMTKLDKLKDQIRQQLDLCDSTETPTICAIKETPHGYADIEKMVIEKVLYGPDPSIANAIVEIENIYNINSVDQ